MFQNEKKLCLAKEDRSKKGSIDEKCKPIIALLNKNENYYTTSSCSGRAYLWTGEKKNQSQWYNVTHDLIDDSFFTISTPGVVWIRVEPFILHVACKDMDAVETLLQAAQLVYKKSSLLSIPKRIVEIRGSEYIEMPFQKDNIPFFTNLPELQNIINQKLTKIFSRIKELEKKIEKI